MLKDSRWPAPTGRLVALAALLAIVVAVLPLPKPWAFLVTNVVLLLVAWIDWLAAPKPSRIGVEREAPAMLTLDGQGDITWTVTNPIGRRIRVSIADALVPSLNPGDRRASGWVPSFGRAMFGTGIRPTRRGKFQIERLVER